MRRYSDCPQILRDFLTYHETIKGQSQLTISEYYLDLRMFLRFVKLIRSDMPIRSRLDEIDIRDITLDHIKEIDVSDVFDFLSYLANDRTAHPDDPFPEYGISAAARARKLSAIKSFYKYLTIRTKLLTENPVAELEYPKLRKSLPRYLTLEQAAALLQAVSGPNQVRDYAILMIFLNCGIRRSELVGLNLSDVFDDRLRVVGKGNRSVSYISVLHVKRQLMRTLSNATKLYLQITELYSGPETETESAYLQFIVWSKKPCSRQVWTRLSTQPTSCAIPRQQ